jgi:Uma2 family endonuclease
MATALKGVTLREYEAHEQHSDIKSEYFRGQIFAMAGASPRHCLIAANLLGEARQLLKGKPCVPYSGDLRVKVEATGLYTYPDATIVCGELELDTEVSNTVVNPKVIVEVLSESTERYDRGQKSAAYRQIPSLKELVLISQSESRVELYQRQAAGGWLLTEASQPEQTLELQSVGISISLSEIYRNVQFDPPVDFPASNS